MPSGQHDGPREEEREIESAQAWGTGEPRERVRSGWGDGRTLTQKAGHPADPAAPLLRNIIKGSSSTRNHINDSSLDNRVNSEWVFTIPNG